MSVSHLARHAVARVVCAANAPKENHSKRGSSKNVQPKKDNSTVASSASRPLDWPNVVVESVGECCTEFLHLVVAEANELSKKANASKSKSKRKRNQSSAGALQHSVLPAHIYESLRTLGFADFISDAKLV